MQIVFRKWRLFACAALLLVIIAFGASYAYGRFHVSGSAAAAYQTPDEANVYVRFDMEAYDKITANYFATTTQYNLPLLFQQSLAKATGSTQTLATSDRAGVSAMLGAAFASATSTDAEKNLALNVTMIALYNLQPAGRDNLLSSAAEKKLRQEVANVNPSTDLYQNLGLQKGASVADVQKAAAVETKTLAASSSPAAKVALQKVTYAAQVLTNTNSKTLYDTAQIEPTLFSHIIGKTLYLNMTKVSPTTLQEFALAIDTASTTPGLDSMIVDLRGNIGGALDFLQGFLGLFIGSNQYAFDLYHQGDYQVQRTTQPQFSELAHFTNIAILTDNMTQSTAELTTATFKKFHLAKVVGGTTRGWGTVENTYPMQTVIDPNEQYALLLVNSITLRDDNQPIEGRGVDPDIDTSKPNWQNLLSKNFTSSSIISALKQEATNAPLQ